MNINNNSRLKSVSTRIAQIQYTILSKTSVSHESWHFGFKRWKEYWQEVQGRNIPSGEYSRVGSPLVKCMAHMENRLEQDNAIVIEIKVKICLRKPYSESRRLWQWAGLFFRSFSEWPFLSREITQLDLCFRKQSCTTLENKYQEGRPI